MKHVLLLISAATIAASLIIVMGCAQNKSRVAMTDVKSEKGFVVMELFTSQGCSSCPPADDILGQYAMKNDEHIIPLAFHVDYWNRLGWVDSFSNAANTERQHYYATKFDLESIYTPQIILNGRKELVGSNGTEIATAVSDLLNEAEPVAVSISKKVVQENTVKISYVLSKAVSNTSINAVLVQANIVTQIRAGENRGVKLNNYNVVRDFNTKSAATASGNIELQLPRGSSANAFSIVLFVQDNESGKIIGAVKVVL